MPGHYNNVRPGDSDLASFGSVGQNYLGREGVLQQLNSSLDPLQGTDEGGLFGSLDLFNSTDANGNKTQGALSGGLGAITGIANLALGYKQYGLAKKELAFQQDQARINNQNQMTTLNNLIRGQADNRRIATGGQSPTGDEYVASNGIRV